MGLFANIKQQQEELKEKKKDYKEIKKNGGKPIGYGVGKYLGGHPDIKVEAEGTITVNKLGFFFEVLLTLNNLHIPIENIVKAEFKTEEQISKDVTLTRLLAFGIFAFGLKKKTKELHSYLVVTYNDCGIENTILFKSKTAGVFASSILKARQEYAKNHPEVNLLNSTPPVIDIPDQIKKLSDLKEQGILSELEFDQKKTELLARI